MTRWLSLILLLMLEVMIIGLLFFNQEQKEEQELGRALDSVRISYQAALQVQDTAMRSALQEVILRQDILAAFAAGVWSNDAEEQDVFRKKLYHLLYPTYQRLVNENMTQFDFHTLDGHNYLRFHQPDKYGDMLSAIRPLLAQVIDTNQPAKGFELGIFGGAFRFIYPLSLSGQRLGVVEAGSSFAALRQIMLTLTPHYEYTFIVRRDAVKNMLNRSQTVYEPTIVHNYFITESSRTLPAALQSPLSADFIALEEQLKNDDDVQKEMLSGQAISRYLLTNGRWYSASLLPVNDVNQRHVGYVIAITIANEIAHIQNEFWMSAFVSSLFMFVLGLLLWRAQREAKLRGEQQKRMQIITDTVGDGLYVVNELGEIIFINPAALQLLGYTSEQQVMGQKAAALFYVNPEGGRGIDPLACPICRVFKTGVPFRGDFKFMRVDDTQFDIEIVSQPIIQGQIVTGLAMVFRDVTSRNAIQKEIIAARELAEQASASKSAFLANMSHEIRTPMNGVLGMTALLQETPLDEEQKDYVQTIRSSGDALLTVIDDILDYSKIEAGMMTIESAPLDIRVLFKDVQRLMQWRVEQKGLRLSLRITDAVPHIVLGDSVRVRQVLLNLIGNAIKFTDQGGIEAVALLTYHSGDSFKIRVEVKDTGIGIAEDKINRLFKSFSQVDDSTTRRFGGTGLGLSISKRLAELMHGEIGATSIEGKGSVFWFSFMVRAAGNETPKETETLSSSIQDLPPARLLLVEDNIVNQKVAMAMLSKLGYKPDIANNGKEALELLREHDYDLVFMDCQMPVMDGFDATRAIRAGFGGRNAQITVVALTANAMKEDQNACYASGMSDYLSKPLQMPSLVAMLKKYLVVEPLPTSES